MGKWVAEVWQPKSCDRIWLGSYRTAEEATRAYDSTAFCLRGPSAMLNFSDCPPVAASRHTQRVAEEEGESGGGGAMGASFPTVAEVFYVGEFSGGYFGDGELMKTRDEEGDWSNLAKKASDGVMKNLLEDFCYRVFGYGVFLFRCGYKMVLDIWEKFPNKELVT
ncbi:ethylene-responsive transcription factor ERF011-like [Rhododendron vialii]|uniref:ethylene-responsive transcription factor ERF011-like n=1 Tax=Rhododendron vialii TaxID=182163 RepID=UPI00265F693B|nr:ethylene-responsive transcription factor ERF011-like [Rhododendron vialii]